MMDYQIRIKDKIYRPKRIIWGGQIAVYDNPDGEECFATRSMIDEIIYDKEQK